MKKIFLFALLLICINNLTAQNVGIGTVVPNASAILDVTAANKGLLIPRVALTDAADITTVPAAAISLLVYNTATAGTNTLAVSPGFYFWNGALWIAFTASDNSNKSAWLLGGNTATNPANNFIGTNDNQSLLFKLRATNAGLLGVDGNTYWGYKSGSGSTVGYSNVAIGGSALYKSTNRSNLVAVGDSALYNNGSGAATASDAVFNTAIGSKALYENTTGSFNSATGFQSLASNVTGFNNTAAGFQSLSQNTFGNANTATGYQALGTNTVGANNTANGQYSLVLNTTGSNNTAVGRNALITNTTGNNNTALGNNADVASNNLTNATAIGNQALVACSDCLVMGSVNGVNGATSSVKVGIGITTPNERLHVSGNIKADTIKPAGILLTPNAGSGKILTSDATGNASWQNNNVTGNIGFGVWGDCATNGNISQYQPLADTASAVGDNFGLSVSVSGNYAIVGANFDSVGANQFQGSASIYQYNGSSWVFMQKITDATGTSFDQFGISVSISGNYAIVGADHDANGPNSGQGSVSIYQFNGSSWVFMQKIIDPTGHAADRFGSSVSISGNYAIAGAWADDIGANGNQGAASIYKYNGSSWLLMQKITDAVGDAGDEFGWSVSISGNYAIIGAIRDNVGASTQGSATIYQYNGSSWVLMQKITDATGALNDAFGCSVSIFGNYAIMGSLNDDAGANVDQGSASIYQYNGSSWVLMQKITDALGAAGDHMGNSVSISGNYIIAGSYNHDINPAINNNEGAAIIYMRVGLGWQKLQYITDPSAGTNDLFGISTAIDGNTKQFLTGASGYAGASGKVVFGKIN